MVTSRPIRAGLIALVLSGPGMAGTGSGAEAWMPVAGDRVAGLLTGRTLVYGPDYQEFFASGRTRYTLLGRRWGWWEIRGGRYCALWPPREDWECFDTEISADGTLVRFTGPDGIVAVGRWAE